MYCSAITTRFWVGILTPAMRATPYLLAMALRSLSQAARRRGPQRIRNARVDRLRRGFAPDPTVLLSRKSSVFYTTGHFASTWGKSWDFAATPDPLPPHALP